MQLYNTNTALNFDRSPLNKVLWKVVQDTLHSQMQGPEKCVALNVGHFHNSFYEIRTMQVHFFHSVPRYSQTDTANADGGKTEGNFLSTAAK